MKLIKNILKVIGLLVIGLVYYIVVTIPLGLMEMFMNVIGYGDIWRVMMVILYAAGAVYIYYHIFKWYGWIKDGSHVSNKSRSKRIAGIKPRVIREDTEIIENSNIPMNTMKLYDDIRIKQCAIGINKHVLETHKDAIRRHWIARSSKERDQQQVKGFMRGRDQRFYEHNGETYTIFHRTHLVPFRYCLNETKQVMVWATGHVNSGSRPQKGYFVTPLDIEQRHDKVMRLIYAMHGQAIIDPRVDLSDRFTHYSLADFEAASDHIINRQPNCDFTYCGQALFNQAGETEKIFVTLYNQTKRRMEFNVCLSNVE